MIELDANYLKERFEYDASTGALFWKKANKRWIGKEAGAIHICAHGKRYIRCLLDGKNVYVHRIIWTMVHGSQPVNIDHIDGDSLNNRIENLRSVTHDVNTKNQRLHSTNTSGHIGVGYRSDSGKWRARIMVDGKPITVGTFPTKEAAIQARDAANSEYGFHENHGKRLSA